MLVGNRVRSKALRRLALNGDESGINPQWLKRVKLILNALDVAVSPFELDLPGWHLHELKGNRSGTYSLRITKNQRITFKWRDSSQFDVNLEDYHG